jgi:hypothetical protein
MLKIFCDRCFEEINTDYYIMSVCSSGLLDAETRELCDKCDDLLCAFLDGGEVVDKDSIVSPPINTECGGTVIYESGIQTTECGLLINEKTRCDKLLDQGYSYKEGRLIMPPLNRTGIRRASRKPV